MALVLAGAVAGAAIGTTRALRKRRENAGGDDEKGYEDEGDEDEDEDEEPSSQSRSAENGSGNEGQSSIRSMAITVLSEALDALQKGPDQAEPEAQEDEDDEMSGDDEEDDDDDDEDEREPRGAREGRPAPRRDQTEAGPDEAVELVTNARKQLEKLIGRDPESATMLERVDGGWRLALEVVELDRIPPSTDVLASYEVTLDGEGRLVDYARTRRYCRNRPDEAM
jgi:hypothetical protein